MRILSFTLSAILVLHLSSCSVSHLSPTQPISDLHKDERIEWPFNIDARNRLLVEVEIEGEQCVVQIDTGASGVSLPHKVIQKLQGAGILQKQAAENQEFGIAPERNGKVASRLATRGFAIGGVAIPKDSWISEKPEDIGLVGGLLFQGKYLSINWDRSVIVLAKQIVVPEGWPNLPFVFRWSNIPIVQSRIETESADLIVDTGANVTVVDGSVLKDAGARLMVNRNAANLSDAQPWDVSTLTLAAQNDASNIVLTRARVMGLPGVKDRVGIAGSLGVDFMRRFPVVIVDYVEKRLVLAPPGTRSLQVGELDAAASREAP